MTILSFFSGTFCGKETITQEVAKAHGLRTFSDQDLIRAASELSSIPEKKISRAFLDKTSVFNKFTHDKERAIAYLRLALAQTLSESGSGGCGYKYQRKRGGGPDPSGR